MKTKSLRPDKVNVITLGCSKNKVDSENLITQLIGNDFDVSHETNEKSDIIIINTCGFIDLAKEESIQTILDYAEKKKEGEIKKLFVTGCLSQRYKDDLEVEIPEVDAFFGTLEMPSLLAKLNADFKHELVGERWISTPSHFAYLKIAEGCNRTCSFCAIPLMRGVHVSRNIEDIVVEAKSLARRGVKELMLISQELTYYGLDTYKKRMLPELLTELANIEGIEWIRLHYAYPSKFPLEIFEVMAAQPKICNYLDMPLQHAQNDVLARMRRQITVEETKELLEKARSTIPGITLRSTFLVGFPGETEAEFEALCDFIAEASLDRVGVFTYSHEESTRAHDLVDDVPEEVKMERANRIMEIQSAISYEKNKAKIGKSFKVLFDKIENGHFVGRTEGDSPEVDNEVLIPVKGNYVRLGDFAEVTITDASEYDLIGVLK
ncbi:MAG: 30S ribosomal protein S12 methylthiotransferase RimO [Bacteroidetes bacterium]|nr:30S ribosomal protein S12 methylthiotransferase RimO [Bacteroidota bacterium]